MWIANFITFAFASSCCNGSGQVNSLAESRGVGRTTTFCDPTVPVTNDPKLVTKAPIASETPKPSRPPAGQQIRRRIDLIASGAQPFRSHPAGHFAPERSSPKFPERGCAVLALAGFDLPGAANR
ncbi:MAG TPA: hypothetical protein VFU48_01395 [Nitrospira sp.]|nr:hypothetical protein [Nitrospira sp.]